MNEFGFDDIQVGLSASFEVEVTASMMDLFLQISGDDNPLHIDDAWARGRGMQGRVVYGLLTASFYSRLIGLYLPGKRALIQSVKTSFHSPVYIGTRLAVSGTVATKHSVFKHIEVKAKVTANDNRLVSKAVITVGFT